MGQRESLKKIRKHFELNKNKHTFYSLSGKGIAVLREKSWHWNTILENEKEVKAKAYEFHFKRLEKEQHPKCKASRSQEIIDKQKSNKSKTWYHR